MVLNHDAPQTVPVTDAAGEATNITVASNFSRLSPEEQRAVNWHVDLQFQKAVASGNNWAAVHKDEYLQNGREGMAHADNAVGLRETVDRFNNPESKARAEALATQREMLQIERTDHTFRSPSIPELPRFKGGAALE